MVEVTGTTGVDTLRGTAGDDFINALGGADRIDATEGRDRVDGGASNDRLYFTIGDPAYFTRPTGSRVYTITADRVFDDTGLVNTTFTGIERLYLYTFNAGDFGDTMDASAYGGSPWVVPLVISTGNGDDRITGSDYDDQYVTRFGTNTVDGRAGFDRAFFSTGNASTVRITSSGDAVQVSQEGVQRTTLRNVEAVTVNSFGYTGGMTVDASATAVSVTFADGAYDDVFLGGAGVDYFSSYPGDGVGVGGVDRYTGGGGADYFDFSYGGAAGIDGTVITDFEEADSVNLSSNDDMTPVREFIGRNEFTGVPGQFRSDWTPGRTFVEFDFDGDASADAKLELANGNFALKFVYAGQFPEDFLRLAIDSSTSVTLGTDAADIIQKGDGRDLIDGYAGADRINGGAGNDEIWGGSGADVLEGGDGHDLLLGHEDGDEISGGPGHDQIEGGAGDDVLNGDDDGDYISGGDGSDRIDGGAGDDSFDGGDGDDVINGGSGSDIILSDAGDDRISGGAGDDYIFGDEGVDTAVFSGVYRQSTVDVSFSVAYVSSLDDSDLTSGIERFQFADGVYVVDPDSAGAQVQRLYDAVLGRAPEQAGLEYWLDQMNDAGRSLQSVAGDFLQSTEFRAAGADVASNGAFTDFLYRATLSREADAGGRDYWVGRLDAGLGRAEMLTLFSESDEHRLTTLFLTSEGYFETDDTYQSVALLYDVFAGRAPDAGGLTYWAEQVKGGQRTLAQVTDAFAGSAEFQGAVAGRSNGQVVDLLYENALDRLPDPDGRAYWAGRLDGGMSLGEILSLFAYGPEHQTLMAGRITGGVDVG